KAPAAALARHQPARARAAEGRPLPVAEQVHDRAAPPARVHPSDATAALFLPARQAGTGAGEGRGTGGRARGRPPVLPLRRAAREDQRRPHALRHLPALRPRRPVDRGRRCLGRGAEADGGRHTERALSRPRPSRAAAGAVRRGDRDARSIPRLRDLRVHHARVACTGHACDRARLRRRGRAGAREPRGLHLPDRGRAARGNGGASVGQPAPCRAGPTWARGLRRTLVGRTAPASVPRAGRGGRLPHEQQRAGADRTLTLVLYYHELSDDRSPLCVSPDLFTRHLQAIADCGATTLTAGDLADALTDGDMPERAVLITFDDAFAAAVREARPRLAAAGMRGTFFCVAGHLGGRSDWASRTPDAPIGELASVDELRALAAGGHELGSHGWSHTPLDGETDLQQEVV